MLSLSKWTVANPFFLPSPLFFLLPFKYLSSIIMSAPKRFQDQQLRSAHFYNEVWVVCPACKQKAIAKVDYEAASARLTCIFCGYHKEVSTRISATARLVTAAHVYFDAELWLKKPFRNKYVFLAFNMEHLLYLEAYIAAGLREHKDRTHFTLLEKLPRFYHEAKNREDLLQLIQKMKEELL